MTILKQTTATINEEFSMNWSFKSMIAKLTQSRKSRSSRREWGAHRTRLEVETLEHRTLLNADLTLGLLGNEPTVAVNPLHPENVVVAQFNTLRISRDFGVTFPLTVTAQLPPAQAAITMPNYQFGGDPSLAFDSAGNLFWCYLTRRDVNNDNLLKLPADDLSVVVQRIDPLATTPGAALVGAAVDVTPGNHIDDKSWIAADTTTGLTADNLSIVWGRLDSASTVMYCRSLDHGLTWVGQATLATGTSDDTGEGFVWPSEVAVASNGDVWVAWHTHTNNTAGNRGEIRMRRSSDGGQIFGDEIVPFPAGLADINDNSGSTANKGSGNPRILRLLSWLQGAGQPRILLDPNNAGTICVVTADDPDDNYVLDDPSDIVFARSTNFGVDWTRTTISHAPAGSIQIMPSAAIDQQGNITVTWYDTRRSLRQSLGVDGLSGTPDDDNFLLDLYATFSTDGGQTFLPNDLRINDNPFDPEPGTLDNKFPGNNVRRIGEYNGLAASNGTAYAVWTGNTFDGTFSPPNPVGQQTTFARFPLRVIDGIEGLDQPRKVRLGYTSNHSPALASNLGTQYLAWTGEDGKLYLDFQNATKNWGPNAFATGEAVKSSPTLVSYNNHLFLGWTHSDGHVNVAVVNVNADGSFQVAPDGSVTLSQRQRLGYTSDHGPALAPHAGSLYLAHVGTTNGELFLDFISPQKTTFGSVFDTGGRTDNPPTLVSRNHELMLGWTDEDDALNVAVVTTGPNGNPTGLGRREPTQGFTSDRGAALGTFAGALFQAHAGTTDKQLFLAFTSPNRPGWGGAIDTEEKTDSLPALATFENRLFVAWRDTDDKLNIAPVTTNLGRVVLPLQTFPVVNGVLTVNGDQYGPDFNDDITIERSGSGGVRITLNGQVVEYPPGVITGIIVNTNGGSNRVNVQATFAEAPVTINGGGMDRLTFAGAPPANPLYTPGPNGVPADGTLRLGGLLINFTGLEFVEGVAPAVAASGLRLEPAVIDENGTVTVSGEFLDPGSFATHRVAINWGDGVSDAPVGLTLGARSFTLTHRYLDDNPTGTPFDLNTITVSVTDNDNLTGTATTTVRVNNLAPQLANVAVTPEIDENGVVTLSGDIFDPGTQDTFTLTVDWGEGAPQSFSYPAGTTHFSATHQYLDDNPTATPQDVYAISLTLTDDDTGQATAAASTLVKNVAPVFTALGTSSTSGGPAREGEPVAISGAFADVGTLDTHTVTVDWGDGIVAPAALTEAGGSGSLSAQHAYQSGGIYPVLVTLRDDDTGAVSRVKAVFVTGVGVHVVGGLTSLQVVGTLGPDQVTIQQMGHDRIRVHADFLAEGKRTLPLAGLDVIQVVVLAGNDHVSVAGSVDLPAVLDGGDGDDHLNGGNAGSVLIGGRGNDSLQGGNSRDILIGGLGADRLGANGGDDILLGGLTLYDSGADDDKLAHDLNLLKLREEWSSGRPYAERLANLGGGVGPVLGGTGLSLHKGTTVFDDLDADVLTGSSGMDWFFFDPFKDKLTGRTGEEETD